MTNKINMEILVVKDYEAVSSMAAALVTRQLKAKPASVLGLPTGRTPEGLYRKLAEAFSKGGLSFDSVRTFNLDDYVGLEKNHPDSYYVYMKEHFFSKVNIRPENIYFLDGESDNLEDECANYERDLDDVDGIDLLILGIGHDGHIGFNEPGESFTSKTHVVNLTESTREANSDLMVALKEVPKQAITMGIGTMLKARCIILLASGADKADILTKALSGPVTEECPASILQTHADVTVIMDDAAAGIS